MRQEHEHLQFRITGWPGVLPHPALQQWFRYALDPDGVLRADVGAFLFEVEAEQRGIDPVAAQLLRPHPRTLTAGRPPEEVAKTGEIYLELIALDLDDSDAILAFVNRFGVLGVAASDYRAVQYLPGFQQHVLPQLKASWPEHPASSTGIAANETLDEFRFGARCVRDLVTAWQIARSPTENAPSRIDWQSIPPGTPVVRPELAEVLREQKVTVDSRYEAQHFLLETLNAGLAPFHPRLLDAGLASQRPDYVFTHVPLYSVCCLELYNHILERAVYRQCGNDNCRRVFVRQTGRAEIGQYRSEGIKYCSKHCARAQAQRQFRARQRTQSRSTRNPRPKTRRQSQ